MFNSEYILRNAETGDQFVIPGGDQVRLSISESQISYFRFIHDVDIAEQESPNVTFLRDLWTQFKDKTFDSITVHSQYFDVEYALRGPVSPSYEASEQLANNQKVENHGAVVTTTIPRWVETISLIDVF